MWLIFGWCSIFNNFNGVAWPQRICVHSYIRDTTFVFFLHLRLEFGWAFVLPPFPTTNAMRSPSELSGNEYSTQSGLLQLPTQTKLFGMVKTLDKKKKIENFSCFVKIIISFLFSFFFFFNGDILSNTTICFGITEHFHWQRQKVFLVIGLSYLIIPFYTHCRPYNLFPDYSQIWYDTAYGLRSKRRSHFRPSLLIFSSYIF